MKPIQILMDEELLKRIEKEARRQKLDRSKLIRQAVAEFLEARRREEADRRDIEGYERFPQDPKEIMAWERIQAWPED